ncbi:hypothetical protein ACP4OV_001371 [Aristida adscensionis]
MEADREALTAGGRRWRRRERAAVKESSPRQCVVVDGTMDGDAGAGTARERRGWPRRGRVVAVVAAPPRSPSPRRRGRRRPAIVVVLWPCQIWAPPATPPPAAACSRSFWPCGAPGPVVAAPPRSPSPRRRGRCEDDAVAVAVAVMTHFAFPVGECERWE